MKSKLVLFTLLLALIAVLPAAAQGSINTSTLTFDGFSLGYDPTFAVGINLTRYPGDPTGADQPFFAEPPYTQFIYYDAFPVPESAFDAKAAVRVYDVAAVAPYAASNDVITALNDLLTNRPDLSAFEVTAEIATENNLPFLPVIAAGQVIRARAEYVDLATIRGIRFITAYSQAVAPLLSNEFLYTFQGITNDGSRYVSVIARLNASMFPTELAADYNPDEFMAGLADYLNTSIAQLQAGADTDFTPTLSQLNALVGTLSYTPMTTTTPEQPPTTTDPSLGGLAGAWTLVSLGSPDAPTAVLVGAPITAVFTAEGVGGSAGCNTYSANFTYNNNTITITQPISTLMACVDEAVMAQESAYLTALAAANSYVVGDATLLINYTNADGTTGVLTFTAVSAEALVPPPVTSSDATLGGLAGSWNLVSHGSADAAASVLPEAPITAIFSAEGVAGNAGCNTYSAAFTYSNGVLSVSPPITTRMACAENIMAQEFAYLTALTAATGYQVGGGTLTINYTNADGTAGTLVFTAAA